MCLQLTYIGIAVLAMKTTRLCAMFIRACLFVLKTANLNGSLIIKIFDYIENFNRLIFCIMLYFA